MPWTFGAVYLRVPVPFLVDDTNILYSWSTEIDENPQFQARGLEIR
jgi:hypothetical protein